MSDQIIVLSDRIKELSHSTGTGALRLEGAATGFSAFGDFYASGDALYYAATDGTDYEVGSGQYLPDGSNNSLVRFPFRSTNGDGLVSFAAGVKEVYVTYPGQYAVFTASGLGPFKQPKPSGLAFWGSSQILCHDDEFVWNSSGNKLGISQPNPQYALDIGGMVSHSQIQASGFLDGGSGVLFSGGQTTLGGTVASGGRQLEPFIRNELDATTGSNAIFFLSGVVDQRLSLLQQEKGTVFAGPPSGCAPVGCSPDYPTFRYLAIDDIPSLSSLYVSQETDVAASLIPAGSVALYKESGVITYDPILVFSTVDNRLGVNVAAPRTTLDVNGTASVSGDILISGDSIITRDLVVGRNAIVSGNLDVRGDLTYIDSSTVTIWDKQLELASMSGTALYNDANVNDAGIVIKSTDTDKEWIWKDATDAWTTDQKIDVSGLVFPGSLFQIGDNAATSGDIHTKYLLSVSGVSGVHTEFITDVASNSGLLLINTSGLSGYFDGKLAALGGGYVNWSLTDGTVAPEAITTTETVTISGVSGIVTQQDGNFLRVSAHGLSGVMRYDIDNVSAGFSLTDGTVAADAIADGQTVTISGASGILTHYNSTTNTLVLNPSGLSGVLTHRDTAISGYLDTKIGALGGGYNYWRIAVGAETPTNVTSTDYVIFNGVSGVGTEYNSATKTLSINPSGLSGVMTSISGYLDTKIGALGGGYGSWSFTDGETAAEAIGSAETVTISGLSGIDTQQDGNFLRISAGGLGSGLVRVGHVGGSGSDIHMDVHGSGQLEHLIFNNDQIRIGTRAGDCFDLGDSGSNWIAIGTQAGSGASGNDFTNMIGYNAGGSTSGCDHSNMFGTQAGWLATGCTYANMIGMNAGHRATGCDFSEMIGAGAGQYRVGCSTGIMIGKSAGIYGYYSHHNYSIGHYAGAFATGCDYSNNLGYYAGQATAYVDYSNMIGYRAGLGASGCGKLTAIGYEAAFGAENCDHIEALGRLAASGMLHSTEVQAIGHQAGMAASGNESTTLIGRNAGFESAHLATGVYLGESAGGQGSGQTHSVGIGLNALAHSSGLASVAALGHSAGTYSREIQSSEMLGHQAGQQSSGTNYSTMIGYRAGYEATGCHYAIMIGWQAGHSASGSSNSIYLGHSAGKDRYGDDNLIINPSNSITLGGWSPYDTEGIIDIADVIHGKHTSSTNKTLSIGKTPSSDTDLSNITLSVRPASAADTVLKTHMEPAQAGDQIQSSTDTSAFSNTIVNKYGWLQVPVVLGSAGGGTSKELYTNASSTSNKYKIDKEDGAIAADSSYMYIAQGGYWYRAALTQI